MFIVTFHLCIIYAVVAVALTALCSINHEMKRLLWCWIIALSFSPCVVCRHNSVIITEGLSAVRSTNPFLFLSCPLFAFLYSNCVFNYEKHCTPTYALIYFFASMTTRWVFVTGRHISSLFHPSLLHSLVSLTLILALEDEGMLFSHRTPLPCRYDQVSVVPLYLPPLQQQNPDAYRSSLAVR